MSQIKCPHVPPSPEPAQHSQGEMERGKRLCKKEEERIGRRREETAKKERIGAE